ncbi:MAG: outer membrane beta-barrel protein [Pirellulaceae bacterium]
MKITPCALAVMCGCALLTSPSWAQALRQPASMRPAALSRDNADYAYRYYDEQEESSPSDAAAAPQEAAPPVDPQQAAQPPAQDSFADVANPCDACCVPASGWACDSCYLFGPDEPFRLVPEDNAWGLNIGFWSQIGYHTEGTNGFGDGLTNDYPNRVQLHQQWLFLEKAVDTGGCGFDWGFRADYVYGTDGPDTQSFGNRLDTWDFGWFNGGAYGHAIPQLYAELGYNDLKAKIGHFYTPMGYEVIPATGNFFYSHAFEFYISEPFTHTGILLEQKVSDRLTVLGGWTAGWDTGFARNGGSNFLGGFKLQLTDDASFSYMTCLGDAGYDNNFQPGSDANGYMHTLLFNWSISDNWTYVWQSNYVDNDILLGSTENTMSFNNYLFYKFNDCWTAGGRLEWFRDPRIGDGRHRGAANEVVDLTVGVNYHPAANVVIRPELRWDDYHEANPLRDTFLFGIDTIITY